MLTMSAPRFELSDDERTALEAMARSTSLPHRVVVQAKGLLLAAEGIANNEIARRCDTTPNAVRRWRSKFDAEGLDGVGRIRPGRGMLCFIDAEWPLFSKPFELAGVVGTWPKRMRELLVRRGPHDPTTVHLIAAKLDKGLRPAS